MEKGPKPEGIDIGEFFSMEQDDAKPESAESSGEGEAKSAKEQLSEFFELRADGEAEAKLEEAKSQDLKDSQAKIEQVKAELDETMKYEEAFTQEERDWFDQGEENKG